MGSLIGVSMPMQRLYASIQRARSHRSPVLIVGEAGTGKELAARAIHAASHRSALQEQPFVSVDCPALAPTLIEPEIFGYAKEAFIGALQAQAGLAGLAQGGTLFLREIAALPLRLQAKLFYALQERSFSPVGSKEQLAFRARVITSSHQDLAELVARGAFREDLYFRLSMVGIDLPPLRERRADIPLLASHFVEKYSQQGESVPNISDAAMECLLAYPWPGNVLELERAVRWAVSFASGAVIEIDDLPVAVRVTATSKLRDPAARLATIQTEYLNIIKALDAAEGDRSIAANLLHIAESALDRKLQSYGL